MKQCEKRLKFYFLILFLLLLLVTGVFLAIGFFRGHFGSAEALRSYIGPFAPLMLTAIQTMQAFFTIIPSFFGFVAGAGLFGAAGGFLAIISGSLLAPSLLICSQGALELDL
ncbi:MAG: hypothetical protein VB112_04395 [Oscillospiraceae bacterium]|nr:hypothetical protein [Oscillospiraceae bacterium]